jgi:hypothetical protein
MSRSSREAGSARMGFPVCWLKALGEKAASIIALSTIAEFGVDIPSAQQ